MKKKDFMKALIISITLLICWAEGGDELLRRLYAYLVS